MLCACNEGACTLSAVDTAVALSCFGCRGMDVRELVELRLMTRDAAADGDGRVTLSCTLAGKAAFAAGMR